MITQLASSLSFSVPAIAPAGMIEFKPMNTPKSMNGDPLSCFELQARGFTTLDLVDERQQVEFEIVQCMLGYGRMNRARGSLSTGMTVSIYK